MRLILIFLSVFSLQIIGQDYNQKKVDEERGDTLLVGYCTREAFEDHLFSEWFAEEYDFYSPVFENQELLQTLLDDIEITIVMGTWCSDSKMQVPAFYRILDELKYDTKRITLISVDREKQSPGNITNDLDIELVPTFILYKDNEELGRIIEIPNETLEKDIFKIISKVKGN